MAEQRTGKPHSRMSVMSQVQIPGTDEKLGEEAGPTVTKF